MTEKKILCLIDTLHMGGAERQITGLAALLKRKNYNIDLATYSSCDNTLIENGSLTINPIILCPRNNKIAKLLAVRKLVKQRKYKVIIAYKDGPNVICCLLKILGCDYKLIVSERNTTQQFNRYEKMKFWFYKFADHIVPNSYSQEKNIRDRYPSLIPKLTTITNYTDIDYFKPLKSDDNVHLNTSVLVVARIAKQKNVLKFLYVIKKLIIEYPDIRFEWFGNVQLGEDLYATECFDTIQNLGISDAIKFYPFTNNILLKYQNCDIFCLPSIFEGYPNAVCEAMSCGKPIICSDVCDNSSIIQDGHNGFLFDPSSIDDMVNAFKKILSMTPEKRLEMGRKSRVIAESLFSKYNFLNRYIELIEN